MKRAADIQNRHRKLNDILLETVGGQKVISTESLAERMGISKRMIWHYLNHFKDEFPDLLAFDRSRNGWFYTKPLVFIDRLALNRDELQQLKIALQLVTKDEGLGRQFGELPTVRQKIEAASRNVNFPTKPEKVIFFDRQHDYEGARHLPFFLEAIEKEWRTAFDYRAYTASEPRAVSFDPAALRQWDGRWYLIGQSLDPTELSFIRVFPLERIVGEPRQNGFAQDRPKNFSPESYWANLYGITDPKEDKTVEAVVLRFSPSQAPYFLGAPFFQPFETLEKSPDGSATVRLFLKINIDLIRKLASYGHELQVLGPPRLVERMRDFFDRASKNY